MFGMLRYLYLLLKRDWSTLKGVHSVFVAFVLLVVLGGYCGYRIAAWHYGGMIESLRECEKGRETRDSEISRLKVENGALKDVEMANRLLQDKIEELRRNQIQEQIAGLKKERNLLVRSREKAFNEARELDREIAKYEAKSTPTEVVVKGDTSVWGVPAQTHVVKTQDKESLEKGLTLKKEREVLEENIQIMQKEIGRIDGDMSNLRNKL